MNDRRWVTHTSPEFVQNAEIIIQWAQALPPPYDSPRAAEVDSRGVVTRLELLRRDDAGRIVVDGDILVTDVVDVAAHRWRWPVGAAEVAG